MLLPHESHVAVPSSNLTPVTTELLLLMLMTMSVQVANKAILLNAACQDFKLVLIQRTAVTQQWRCESLCVHVTSGKDDVGCSSHCVSPRPITFIVVKGGATEILCPSLTFRLFWVFR
jgi:hypothetical protein